MGSFRFHIFSTPIVFSFVTDLYSKIVESMHLEFAFVSPAKGFVGMKQLLKNQSCNLSNLVRLKPFEIDISMTDCTQGSTATEPVLVRVVWLERKLPGEKAEKKTEVVSCLRESLAFWISHRDELEQANHHPLSEELSLAELFSSVSRVIISSASSTKKELLALRWINNESFVTCVDGPDVMHSSLKCNHSRSYLQFHCWTTESEICA